MFGPDDLRNHIGLAEVAALEKVPGIGKKVAARIILELQDKFQTHGGKNRPSGKWRNSLKDALISLGYSAKEAEKAIDQVVTELAEAGVSSPDNLELSELLKKTLSQVRK
jgi:Holliday junction DNA helicase RuvA